jgi:hypothetical protein
MQQPDYRAFQQLLRARRRSLSPRDVGLPERPRRTGPQIEGLLQTDVDALMDTGIGTYQKVESLQMTPSPRLLRKIALALRFKESEFVQCHLDLHGTAPGLSLYPDASLSVPPAYKEKVQGQHHMCYVQNRRWQPIYWNAAFVDLFPSRVVPDDLARWWLTSKEARDPHHGVMINWDALWGPLLVPQFVASVRTFPDDEVLQETNRLVQQDERVRRLYQQGENAYIHPDGDRRPLRHGTLGPGWATLLAETPQAAPGAREMTIIFHPDKSAAEA